MTICIKDTDGVLKEFSSFEELFLLSKEDLETIVKLDCSKFNFSVIPVEILKLINLKAFDCSFNYNIKVFPKLPISLKYLDFSFTGIESIPYYLTELEVLKCRWSCLNKIRFQIGSLKKLKVFDVSETRVSSIPSQIEFLCDLEIIHIDNSNISLLPKEIAELKKLKYIFYDSSLPLRLKEPFLNGWKKIEFISIFSKNDEASLDNKSYEFFDY